ncbi:mitochondrial import receptor subunit TOM22 homolog [Adelges cooleyi]|uniref:mitochondrial import receptor subunit TOM22 homolog n=1 Tax=Adelges cooleyi TaxID=133065 RepID=UPI00217F68A9|nr:mitochondrial import receptor subunit TOM22 homolog [Adelges cooleyi]
MERENAMNNDSDTESMAESRREGTAVSENVACDEEDETVVERLWALTEMFPKSIRKHTNNLISITKKAIGKTYSFACDYTWCISTAGTLLVLPCLFENECARVKEIQKRSSRKLLFGTDHGNGSLSNGTTILPY